MLNCEDVYAMTGAIENIAKPTCLLGNGLGAQRIAAQQADSSVLFYRTNGDNDARCLLPRGVKLSAGQCC
jgi:hypothetical protein